jgi:histo-blood group ABO system transferase
VKVGLCVVCTGRYIKFLKNFMAGARTFFCPQHYLRLFVFADCEITGSDVSWYKTAHEPWPGPTLHRYRSTLAARGELLKQDFLYTCDVDMGFADTIGDEIFGDLVATLHPGFVDKTRDQFTYERRPESRACSPAGKGVRYYAGGFQGGRSECYVEAMKTMSAMIDDDERRGIVPIWHDESALNAYLVMHPPTLTLPPTFCCQETRMIPGRKLLCLNKDHKAMRAYP